MSIFALYWNFKLTLFCSLIHRCHVQNTDLCKSFIEGNFKVISCHDLLHDSIYWGMNDQAGFFILRCLLKVYNDQPPTCHTSTRSRNHDIVSNSEIQANGNCSIQAKHKSSFSSQVNIEPTEFSAYKLEEMQVSIWFRYFLSIQKNSGDRFSQYVSQYREGSGVWEAPFIRKSYGRI